MARQMKDSGIEWIGEIPETWDTIKFKYLFSITGGNGFPESLQGRTEGKYPFCKVSDINGHSDYVDAAANYISDEVVETHGFNIIPCGSIIIAKIGAALQKNHRKINSVQCCIDNNTQALVPVRNDSIRYLLYLTRCIDMGWFDNNSTVPSLNNNKLLNFFVPNVSVDDQQRIADFLDRRCAEIDAVIERTKTTIEEYKKLKQAVITEAVTKGVRGERKMKDSGIDWMGEVPQTFEIVKIKYVTDISRGLFNHRPRNDERYYGGSYPFIQTGDVAKANKYITTYSQTLNELGISVSKLFPKGTMTMTIAANVGDVAILGFDAYFPDSVVGFTPKAGFMENYVYYLFCALREMFIRTAVVSTQLNLNVERIKDIFVPVTTDTNEQKEIADYLDEKCAALDTLIAKKTALLTELETYKKSLIYEYVTGKKEA